MLPILDQSTAAGRDELARVLAKLRGTSAFDSEASRTVAQIVADVRADGDAAVVRYMRQWTDASFTAQRIRVSEAELAAAEKGLDRKLRGALATAIKQVRAYQKHIMPRATRPVTIGGAELGLRFTPVDSVGLAVPGGKAAYPSSVVMLAVPALVAGVPADRISVVTPPPTRRGEEPAGNVSPLVLATCAMLGIRRVYRIGGAQAIAALALGTQSVEPVDLIAGPGNVYVQLAKAQLNGVVGTDNGFYGPSEIITLADASADPRKVAADLIAQAEHDPGKCFLVAWSRCVIERIIAQIEAQKFDRARLEAIEAALANESAAVLVKTPAQAVEVANRIAAEHVNLAVKDPRAWLKRVRHGGEFFLGDGTPVAAGDYYAGPSHCLPTGTTARFASGVSVYTFLKRSGTVQYKRTMPAAAIDAIARLAEAEGLDGHAASVRARR
ncbi:MAG: histidinol dehydrogenase [Phycisphaeraceae bacterium]